MSTSTFTLKWGILATGGIAETFARDLHPSPTTRGVNDISHVVVAAASSSSASRAQDFLKEVRAPDDAKAYGSYKELVNDPNVDCIYIATPHSHHYQNCRLALEAGKNVLCEKAFTVNASQLEVLMKIAREKGVFLMEAVSFALFSPLNVCARILIMIATTQVWTRYFPLSIYVREAITSGRIGTVHRTTADLSIGEAPESAFDDSHRMVNPSLAGGALLDLGIYALTWVFQTLYTTQSSPQPPSVVSQMEKYKTGADEQTLMLLTFPREGGLPSAHGVATTGFRTSSNVPSTPAIRIQGDKGEVQVFHPAFRPTQTRLVLADGTVEDKDWPQPGPGKGSGWKNGFGGSWQEEGVGQGMFWEADEAAYAIRDGRKEGRNESLEESLAIMKVMDEVRRANGLVYPTDIESTEYPLEF
jgi:predicted dehydrogenase